MALEVGKLVFFEGRAMREAAGLLDILYMFTWVGVTGVCTHIKIHPAVHFRLVCVIVHKAYLI